MSAAGLALAELGGTDPADDRPRPRDLRAAALGLAAWLGGLAGLLAPALLVLPAVLTPLVLVTRSRWRGPGRRLAVLAGLLVALAVGGSALLREEAVRDSLVADLARSRAAADLVLVVSTDPRRLDGQRDERWLVRGTVREVSVAGRAWTVRTPVVLVGGPAWAGTRLGSTQAVDARLGPAEGDDVAAFVVARSDPRRVADASVAWRAAGALRASVRDAASAGPWPHRALVPALVDGDDQELPEQVQEEFRTAGLTHLLAVSGTNLTLVVGALLVAGRWCGVRGRWQYLLGALGIAGFLLLARTEPSVVRAAAMGTVALLGMGANGVDRGLRALGIAVLGLLLWDPWLATTVGFALSVLATSGILLLAPVWVRAMRGWLPGWAAAAVAVPLAAQLACTPVVAAISGEVSLVAVLANVLAAPFVAPATVLGLLGGVVGLLLPAAGRLVGLPATWAAAAIVTVGDRAAGLALPSVPWSTAAPSLALLTALCLALAAGLGPVLARRHAGLAAAATLLVVVLVPVPRPGWPPDGWALVACDVGQGDGLVLRAGEGQAVVVDTGPEPAPMDRCLDRLGIHAVPLVVLTHFHADHVGGLAGVYDGRSVGAVDVSWLREPAAQAASVLAETGGRARVPRYGEVRTVGDVRLQVVGPLPAEVVDGPTGDDGSAPNNASVVLLAQVGGVRILLTGDAEPEAQAALARSLPGLRVDVLKVPHHGSRFQEMAFLTGLGARVAIASVGADNDYGHPATATMEPLAAAGASLFRTDRHGDVAVVTGPDGLAVRTSR